MSDVQPDHPDLFAKETVIVDMEARAWPYVIAALKRSPDPEGHPGLHHRMATWIAQKIAEAYKEHDEQAASSRSLSQPTS